MAPRRSMLGDLLHPRTRSVCETTPSIVPASSTTGAPLMAFSPKIFASSDKDLGGRYKFPVLLEGAKLAP